MPKSRASFLKRQREVDKKQKREAKLQRKLDKKTAVPEEQTQQLGPETAEEIPQPL